MFSKQISSQYTQESKVMVSGETILVLDVTIVIEHLVKVISKTLVYNIH